ncbi:MAG: winged helix-turn-helix transcriptional regulator [Actinobacteria bacterium]|nr:winged helix-turn-helix transcriptional regulator [Actinomycetota bacterium]
MGDRVDAVFDALADPSRRYLVERLAELGASTPTELADELPITRQAVTKHLAQLEQAGLVRGTREGRRTVYRPDLTALEDATGWLERVGARWDERLAALARHLDGRDANRRQ